MAAMGKLPEGPVGWASTLLKECIHIKKALRRQTPPPVSSLTEHELYALLCYTMELRKKWKQADVKMNFAAKVSALVLHELEDVEMTICTQHFKKALEKCQPVTLQPPSLFCVMMNECLEQIHEFSVGEEVYWPTYTSWSSSKEPILQAAHALGGFVVQLDAPRSASDISVFRSAPREAPPEFVLPVNTALRVKMVATDAGETQVVLLLEEVDDED